MIAIVAVINGLNAQMSKADKFRIIEVNKKINELNVKINNYDVQLVNAKDYSSQMKNLETKYDSLSKLTPTTSYGLQLKNQAIKENRFELSKYLKKQSYYNDSEPKMAERDSLIAKLAYYQKIKDKILESYLNGEADGPGMSNFETRRELNKIKAKRQNRLEETEEMYRDLDFKRLNSQPVYTDTLHRYKGIVQNFCIRSRMQFVFYRIDGVGQENNRSVLDFIMYPGQKIDAYLIAGTYVCKVFKEGRQIDSQIFPVTSELKSFFGEPTHWFAAREGY